MKKIILIVISLIIFSGIIFVVLRKNTSQKDALLDDMNNKDLETVHNITIFTVGKDELTDAVIVKTALVKAESKVDIYSKGGGTVKGVYFETGDEVTEGTILAAIEIPSEEEGLKLSLENAKTSLQNFYTTAELNLFTSQKQAENAKITWDTARKNYEIAVQTAAKDIKLSEKALDIADETLDLVEDEEITSMDEAIAKLQKDQSKISRDKTKLLSELSVKSAFDQAAQAKISYEQALEGVELTKQANISQIDVLKNGIAQTRSVHASFLENLSIKAPSSGRIICKDIDQGAYVLPGTKIGCMQAGDFYKAEIYLSSEEREKIEINDSVSIRQKGDKNGESIPGAIYHISPTATENNNKYLVEVHFRKESLHITPESFVEIGVSIPGVRFQEIVNGERKKSYLIPLNALIIGQSENFVFVVDDENKAQEKAVTIGDVYDQYIEITEGIEDDDRIIVDGAKTVKEGDRVNF